MERASNLRNKIDFDTIDSIRSFTVNYDRKTDSLILQPNMPVPAVSVDWDGDLWVRVNPDKGKVVGIEIEGFRGFFSKKYQSILSGRGVTDPIIKEIVVALLKSGPKPFTKKEFIRDLERICQRIAEPEASPKQSKT